MAERAWPSLSVVIPARNSAATLPATLDAVLEQEYPGGFDVAVAVGPSDDDTAAIVAAYAERDPRVQLVDNPNGTTPVALNLAIGATTGEIVARVDAHSVLPHGYLQRAVEVLEATGADEVGGIQDGVGTTNFERAVAAAMRSPFGAGGATYRKAGPPQPVETVYLGVFRRTALKRVGGYAEDMRRNQDYELNTRIRASGGQVWFHPDLRVAYRPRGSLRALARQYHDYGRWKQVGVRRHPASLRLRQAVPPLATAALVASLLAVPVTRGRSLPVPAGYTAAVTAAGLAAGRAEPWPVRVRIPLVLATMHIAWGLGFIRGVEPGVEVEGAGDG